MNTSELMEYNDLVSLVKHLEARIECLEEENIGLSNAMYEIANSLEARIDILSCEPYNLPFTAEKLS